MMFKSLAGKHYVKTTSHSKIVDWAQLMKIVSDELYPEAEVIVVVMDNLNTHKLASFYAAFEPKEIHHTPKHGSWSNMLKLS